MMTIACYCTSDVKLLWVSIILGYIYKFDDFLYARKLQNAEM